MAKVDSKPGYSVSGKGLQNTIHQDSFSTKNSKFYKDEQEANCSCGFGIKGDVEERGNNENSTCSRGVFEHLIPYGEKRRRLSPCDKSKNVEPVNSFSSFQNGRPFSVKAHNTGGRLDVQTGPEGCILQCPIRSKLEEVRKDSVEGDSLQVHVPVFLTRPSTKGVCKAIENPNLSPEKDQYQNDNIFGRYVDFESHNTTNSHEPGHSHVSPAEFGLYNKCKEINFAPMSENRISGNGDRFNQNDFVIDTREGGKSCQDLPEPSQESFYNSSGIDQGCGFPIIHNTSSGTCKYSVKISSATTNCVSKEKNELSVSNNIKHQVKNRVHLVVRELEVLQWPNFFSVEPTDASLTGWGSNPVGFKHQGNGQRKRDPYT